MKEIIDALQKEVYRLDWQIGVCANDLKQDNKSTWDRESDEKFYVVANNKRKIIIECIEQLNLIS